MTPATVNATDQADVNIAIVRRLMEEGFSNGNLAVIEELISADCVEHQRGNGSGVEGVKRVVSTLHGWFSDFRLEIEDVVARGDTVWIRNRATGTNTGRFLGFEATYRPIDITVFDVVRIEGGRVVEHWGVPDQLGVALQLGLFAPSRTSGHGPETE
jgi:predicted ester cyclase